MIEMNDLKLGNQYKDSVTGVVGVATAYCMYLNGCISIEITPNKLKNGLPVGHSWVDIQQLIALKQKEKPVSKKTRIHHYRGGGGPGNIPPARSVPSRDDENE